MTHRLLIALSLMLLVFGFSSCEQVKSLIGQGEEEAGDGEEKKAEPEKAAASDEAGEAAEAARIEAEKQTEALKAEAEKAKAEAEEAKAEVEKAKSDAEDDKKAMESKAKRQELTRQLAEFTAEVTNMKNQITVTRNAWNKLGIQEKDAEFEALLKEHQNIETERVVVEGLMVQGKLDEAQTRLEVVKAKFPTLKDRVAPLLAEKPTDPKQWNAMLNILAEETCLMRKNLPSQEFNTTRDTLFTTHNLDRVVYEQLRAQFNKESKTEDQAFLGQKIAELCPPEPDEDANEEGAKEEGAKEEGEKAEGEKAEGEKAEHKKTEGEKAEHKKAEHKKAEDKQAEDKTEKIVKNHANTGKYAGKMLVPGKTGSISLTLKSGKTTGKVKVGGKSLSISGTLGKNGGTLTGKGSGGHLKCSCRTANNRISGTCAGKVGSKVFKKARFTANKK